MKPTPGTFALLSIALCLPLHAQDLAPTASQSVTSAGAQPASRAVATSTVGLSDIRIVRLSQVRGAVEIDRHVGRGYETAFANIPVTGGAKLRTELGLAEIEFEDNSTLRLTPDTEVVFTQLKRNAGGNTLNGVSVLHGMIYASLANTKGNTFTIAAGDATLQLNPSSHIRLTVAGPESVVSVFDGTVQFTDPLSSMTLTRNKALAFDPAGSKPATFTKNESNALDQWDKTGNDYQKRYSALAASAGSGFGSSDLNYYGSFVNMPGCGGGSFWRPYFASAAWTPYDAGVWAYYPGVGYSWVSPYPWGWLPFHSGTWMSCGINGWGWQPGGQFVGLQNMAVTGTRSTTHPLPTQPAAPRGGAPAMVMVNAHPLAVSSVSAPGTFTFRKDSAGLGVPRDAFGDLKSVSADVGRRGEANTEVQRAMIGPPSSNARENARDNAREASRQALGNGVYERRDPPSRPMDSMNRAGGEIRGNASEADSSRESLRGMATASSPGGRMSSSNASAGSPSNSGGGRH